MTDCYSKSADFVETNKDKLAISANNSNISGSSGISNLIPENVHGHYFVKKTFHKPVYCHHCAEMLWGLIGQGFICDGFNLLI